MANNKTLLAVVLFAVAALCVLVAAEKEQEPHYKNGVHNQKAHPEGEHHSHKHSGCPHAKAHKCPEMRDGDCPYVRSAKDSESVKEHWHECPKFKEGCPYNKDAETLEKAHDCPQFKEGCPYKEGENIQGSPHDCPAFKEGCPYHKHSSESHGCPIKHSIDCPYMKEGSGEVKEEVSRCPKFKEDCPYSHSKEELEKLHGCPVFKEGCPFEKGEDVDVSKWKNCPAFNEGCPYDLVHYEGHKLKERANQFVEAILTGGKLDEFVSDNFIADVIGISDTKVQFLGINRKDFEELLEMANWKVSVTNLDQLADDHIVVLNSRVSGTKESKELRDLALITFHHFNKAGRVEKLQLYFDGVNYGQQKA